MQRRDNKLPTKRRSQRQVKSERRALKKLRAVGLLPKSVKLNRKPNAAAKRALRSYADVISGKSVALKPANPKSYKSLFKVRGKTVIVPKRKGERIRVNNQGKLTGSRNIGGKRITYRYEPGATVTRERNATYAIPFANSTGGVHIQRFPNFDELKKFMEGYSRYKNWRDYVVVTTADIDDEEILERSETKRAGRQFARERKAFAKRRK